MIFLEKLVSWFRKSEFAKGFAILSVGTILPQLFSISLMPIMSRLYSPAAFGLFAVFIAVSSIVATTITLRYETAILLPKDENEAKSLVQLSFGLSVLLGSIGVLVAWSFSELFILSSLGKWTPLAVLAGMTSAFIVIGTTWLNRNCAYRYMAKMSIFQSVLSSLAGIIFGIYGFTEGLILAQVLSTFITALVIFKYFSTFQYSWSKRSLNAIAIKHSSAPKYLLPTAIIDTITQQLPVLLIISLFGNESAGEFSMAWRVSALPFSLVGGTIGQIFLQHFAQIWPDVASAKRLLFKTWKTLALIGLFPLGIIMLAGPQLFTLILGGPWADSGRIAAVLSPMLLVMFISSPTSGIYLVLGLQRMSLLFGLSFLVYRSLCIYVGFWFNNLYFGLTAWALCEIVAVYSYNKIALRKMAE